ncbi:MAG TPA: tetrahydrofolate dehydrogenase/cyclohydrolase catalytic domain-containing protein [Bryobacteraceae bacterium]|jgi:methylenetetrahydrofolate dehydrogenase (NADP+)/methenyltetrahydrofolate cyclohydrolase
MAGIVLDGKSLSREIESKLAGRVAAIKDQLHGTVPRLATILVGDDPSSATYVRMKANACRRVGMDSLPVHLPETTTTTQLLGEIRRLNTDRRVFGILLQHPVPGHINERECFDAIGPEKDVDGVTSLSYGRLALGEPAYRSATPGGIMTLLQHYGIALEGKEAVVVGRSPILGKPMAALLLNANATVTICHSRTRDLPSAIKRADVIVGAVGKPEFIKASWIRDGAVVVDAGYHPRGVGDIELSGIADRCAAWTPVPGGVGPMTIATLITQTVESAEALIARRGRT